LEQQQIYNNNTNFIYCTDSENLFRFIAVVLSSLSPGDKDNFVTKKKNMFRTPKFLLPASHDNMLELD